LLTPNDNPKLQPRIHDAVLSVWPNATVTQLDTLQSLWSNYGAVVRVHLQHAFCNGAALNSVVAKVISPPENATHPRGWHSQASQQRKLRSYQVERHFYQRYANACSDSHRVPYCFGSDGSGGDVVLLLEDLDIGYPRREDRLDTASVRHCLQWLASFHAHFLGTSDAELWERGGYWYLATRSDEFAAMPDGPLKNAACSLDRLLANCTHQTLLHGDAKVANFCFSRSLNNVAAVDFQYVGRGCGIQDVAYLLGSCLTEETLKRCESELLHEYQQSLVTMLKHTQPMVEAHEVAEEWGTLYAVAAADFHRFLSGWSPGHKKLTAYSEDLVARALQCIDNHS
jgi:hypothetical protein